MPPIYRKSVKSNYQNIVILSKKKRPAQSSFGNQFRFNVSLRALYKHKLRIHLMPNLLTAVLGFFADVNTKKANVYL